MDSNFTCWHGYILTRISTTGDSRSGCSRWFCSSSRSEANCSLSGRRRGCGSHTSSLTRCNRNISTSIKLLLITTTYTTTTSIIIYTTPSSPSTLHWCSSSWHHLISLTSSSSSPSSSLSSTSSPSSSSSSSLPLSSSSLLSSSLPSSLSFARIAFVY